AASQTPAGVARRHRGPACLPPAAPGRGWAAPGHGPAHRVRRAAYGSRFRAPAQADDSVAMADDEVGIGPVDDDGVALHRRVHDELLAALAVTGEHRWKVAARKAAAIAHPDVGEAPVVVDGGGDQPSGMALAVCVLVAEVV